MAKKSKHFRLDQNIIKALECLKKNTPNSDMTSIIETLIFRESMYKLSAEQLFELYGEEYERLIMQYAVKNK